LSFSFHFSLFKHSLSTSSIPNKKVIGMTKLSIPERRGRRGRGHTEYLKPQMIVPGILGLVFARPVRSACRPIALEKAGRGFIRHGPRQVGHDGARTADHPVPAAAQSMK
jgi:hypothetical protein